MIKSDQAPQQKDNPWLPYSTEPFVMEEWQGIDTATTRAGVKAEQVYWMEGYMPIARRNLRTLYGVGPVLFSAGAPIEFFDFVNIGATPFMMVVDGNGAVTGINMFTGVPITVMPNGTLLNPIRTQVGFSQWGGQYAIIVSSQGNGYWLWDGTTLYSAGGPAPPAIGGVMPTGVNGTDVTTYSGHVWVANGPTILYSAPGSPTNFATNGAGNFTSVDSFLKRIFTRLVQSNGFLYLVADSSINYISGVQTSGSPAQTTFTNQNADPEVGTIYPGSVITFGRNIVLANLFGIHSIYGAQANKISTPLDGVYTTAIGNFGINVPCAAKATIFGRKVLIMLVPIINPLTNLLTYQLMMWDGRIWWSSLQEIPLTFINGLEIDSQLTAWGTDGASIRQLFFQPSSGLRKLVRSRLSDEPGGYEVTRTNGRLWGLMQYHLDVVPPFVVVVDSDNGSGASYSFTPTGIGLSGVSKLGPEQVSNQGVLVGMTCDTFAPDMSLISMKMDSLPFDYRG